MKSSQDNLKKSWNHKLFSAGGFNSPSNSNTKNLEGLLKTIDQNCLKSQSKRPKSPDCQSNRSKKLKVTLPSSHNKIEIRPISPPSNDNTYNSIKRIRCDSSLDKSPNTKNKSNFPTRNVEKHSQRMLNIVSKTPKVVSKEAFAYKTEESYKSKARSSFSDKESSRNNSVGTIELDLSTKKGKVIKDRVLQTSNSKKNLNYRAKSSYSNDIKNSTDNASVYAKRISNINELSSPSKGSAIQNKISYKNFRNENSNHSASADTKTSTLNFSKAEKVMEEVQTLQNKNDKYAKSMLSYKPKNDIKSSPRLPISNVTSNNTSRVEDSVDDIQEYQSISNKLHKLENKIIDIKKNIESKRKSRGNTGPPSNEDIVFSDKGSNISKQESYQKKSFTEFDENWKEQLKKEVLFREKIMKDQVIKIKSMESQSLRSVIQIEKGEKAKIEIKSYSAKKANTAPPKESNIFIDPKVEKDSSTNKAFQKGFRYNKDESLLKEKSINQNSLSPENDKYKSFSKSMKFKGNEDIDSKEAIAEKRKALLDKFSKLETTSRENISKSEKELKISKLQFDNETHVSIQGSDYEKDGDTLRTETRKSIVKGSSKESAYLIDSIRQAKSNLSRIQKTREQIKLDEQNEKAKEKETTYNQHLNIENKVESELSKALKRLKENKQGYLLQNQTIEHSMVNSSVLQNSTISVAPSIPEKSKLIKSTISKGRGYNNNEIQESKIFNSSVSEVSKGSNDLNSFVTKVTLGGGSSKPESNIKMTMSRFVDNEPNANELSSSKVSLRNSLTSSNIKSNVGIVPNKFYINKMLRSFVSNGQDYFAGLFREHMSQCAQSASLVKGFAPISSAILLQKQIMLPKLECYRNKKTLIFDLDETLVHCNDSIEIDSDIILPVKFPTGEIVQAGINIRPFARECLQELSLLYEIIVFTASHSCYANVVIDHLDPQKKFIKHRLYREHCICNEDGLYIKDLRVINRDMKDMILVDNAFYSFAYQINNGLPILPFYYEKNDTELNDLTDFLKEIHRIPDVRDEIKKRFRMDWWGEFENPLDIVNRVFSDVLPYIR